MKKKSNSFLQFQSPEMPLRAVLLRDLVVEYVSEDRYEIAIMLCKKLKKNLETEQPKYNADLIIIKEKILELKKKLLDFQCKNQCKSYENKLEEKEELTQKGMVYLKKLIENSKDFTFDELVGFINNRYSKLTTGMYRLLIHFIKQNNLNEENDARLESDFVEEFVKDENEVFKIKNYLLKKSFFSFGKINVAPNNFTHFSSIKSIYPNNLLKEADSYDLNMNLAKVEELELKVLEFIESNITFLNSPNLCKAKLKSRLLFTYINQGKIKEAEKLFYNQ